MAEDKKDVKIKQLETTLAGLQADYEALRRGWYMRRSATDTGREPIYRVEVTEWQGGSGSVILSVNAKRLVDAKTIESALKMLFIEGSIKVSTSVKDDVWEGTGNFHSV